MRRVQVGATVVSKILGSNGRCLSPSHFKYQYPLSLSTTFFSNALLHNNLPTKCKFPLNTRSFYSLDTRRRSILRRFTIKEVVVGLIATNVAVYLLWKVADPEFMVMNFVVTVHHIKDQRLHTLLTSAFSHRSQIDLITTVLGLYFFGTNPSLPSLIYKAFLAPPFQGKMKGIDNSLFPAMGGGGAVNAIMLLNVFLFPSKTILLMGGLMGGFQIWRLHKGDARVSASTYSGGATVAAFAWLIDRKRRFTRF